MSMNEVITTLRQMNRVEKMRVMQFLVLDLTTEEEALLSPNTSYPIWSPYDSFEAANTLLEALKTEEHHA